jgi:hypothetical protein
MIEMDDVEIPIVLAYWHKKRRWVAVPLFHIPQDAIAENGDLIRIRVTPLDGQEIRSIPTRKRNFVKAVNECIVPSQWSQKDLKQLCVRNDISFFWLTGKSSTKSSRGRRNAIRREYRKIKPLTPKQFRKRFLRELKKISKQTALIAQILWFFNKVLGKGGTFVTLEEILRLKIEDVAPDPDNWIRLMRTGTYAQLVHFTLPQYFWKSLCDQIDEDSIFVFSNRDGGPLLPGQIERHFRKAGKQSGIKETVTSLSLRPLFNKKGVRITPALLEDAPHKDYSEISTQEWDLIVVKIPFLINKRGCKSKYHPRDLFNGILYHLGIKCPFRKLPDHFPPWQAVDSQYRRWKKRGIIEQVFDLRVQGKPFD